MKENLSARGKLLVKDMPPLVHADFSIRGDLYHPEKNPGGYINMGTAETHLINDEVIELLTKTQSRMTLKPQNLHYDFFQGSTEFRTAIANHWQGVLLGADSERRITPDNIVIGAGCSLALEMLATMLGDPGDAVLVPAPYYSGFEDDFNARACVKPVGVHCGAWLSKKAFDDALLKQKEQGRRVCAVLLSSPNNPVGTVYTPEALNNIISFCMENDLDIICDEIYAQTIHDEAAEWVSMLSLVPDAYLHRVHITSSFAKDFALSGFRTGFAISFNTDLLMGMQNLSYFSAVSTHTQALLSGLLRAPELPELLSKNREQLRIAYGLMERSLNEMGIKTLPAQGGIFIFADFADYLDKQEFPAEYTLWRKIFGELKLNISPGQLFDAERPGWFRICYAQAPAIVEETCRRLRTLKKA